MPHAFDDLRHEEHDAVIGGNAHEIDRSQRQHAAIGERLHQRRFAACVDLAAFFSKLVF
jgi:hypothetical protein